MKYKTQFRLAIQAIALWLALSEFSHLAAVIVNVLQSATNSDPSFAPFQDMWYWQIPGSVVPLLLYIWLFLRPGIIVNIAIPSNKPYCPECGYQLVRPLGAHCTECGTALPNSLREAVDDNASGDSSP